MKTQKICLLRSGALALLALLPLASTASAATDAAANPSNEPQTHVLFTGADIHVLYDGKLYPVDDVDGTSMSFRIKDNAKGLGVPLDYKRKQFVVKRVLNVTDRSVTVANFKHERAYTAAKDPYKKASEAILNGIAMADRASALETRLRAEPEKITGFYHGIPKRPGEPPVMQDNQLRQRLENQARIAQSMVNSDLGNAGKIAGNMANEKAREDFDALEVECTLSSASPIKRAYLVVMANYHTKDKPNDSQMWVAAKELGAIDSTPRQVWLHEGGLPSGYILENVQLHVYEHGTETATDLSENRASLTRDEAHQYLMIEHASAHKDDTVPARLVLLKVPTDWATHPRDTSFLKTFFVKVDNTGHPVAAFEDETCETAVANSYYGGVLRDQLFLPALEKGQPVDSVVKIKLTKLPH